MHLNVSFKPVWLKTRDGLDVCAVVTVAGCRGVNDRVASGGADIFWTSLMLR